ncbi:hypothetical protein HK100_010462, partial [Physocladia obscura]
MSRWRRFDSLDRNRMVDVGAQAALVDQIEPSGKDSAKRTAGYPEAGSMFSSATVKLASSLGGQATATRTERKIFTATSLRKDTFAVQNEVDHLFEDASSVSQELSTAVFDKSKSANNDDDDDDDEQPLKTPSQVPKFQHLVQQFGKMHSRKRSLTTSNSTISNTAEQDGIRATTTSAVANTTITVRSMPYSYPSPPQRRRRDLQVVNHSQNSIGPQQPQQQPMVGIQNLSLNLQRLQENPTWFDFPVTLAPLHSE